MNSNNATRTSPFNIIAVAAALLALAAIVASARSSADVATAATTAVSTTPQGAASDVAAASLPAETPASMSYHDSINVAAIAVAAYDR